MADPFIEIAAFQSEYGPLTAGQAVTAARLLQVVSDWIRDHASDGYRVTDAQQVVFEVVRDAVRFGDYERLSSFTNTTSRRTEAGTFDEAMKVVDDYLTNRHKRLLGIPLRAAPRGTFKKCDY